MVAKKSTVVSFRFSHDELLKLEKLAKRLGRSQADIAREFVLLGIQCQDIEVEKVKNYDR